MTQNQVTAALRSNLGVACLAHLIRLSIATAWNKALKPIHVLSISAFEAYPIQRNNFRYNKFGGSPATSCWTDHSMVLKLQLPGIGLRSPRSPEESQLRIASKALKAYFRSATGRFNCVTFQLFLFGWTAGLACRTALSPRVHLPESSTGLLVGPTQRLVPVAGCPDVDNNLQKHDLHRPSLSNPKGNDMAMFPQVLYP
ncbi:uncharacterized protein PG998_002856 [Apiospora kogelbergensis]|uniref:uncharacterized protein n=1 Tax=Apiospora kogelbergensis TaxID=1337665 RepID=UPI00312CE54A